MFKTVRHTATTHLFITPNAHHRRKTIYLGFAHFLPPFLPLKMSRTHHNTAQGLPPQTLARPSQRPIFVWDTETTGLSSEKNNLVEIALQELPCTAPTCVVYNFASLIHPVGVKMPRAATRVHGITNQMMQDSPTFSQVWPDLLEFVNDISANRGRPLFVAHNLSFDLRFLRAELSRIGEPFPDWDFACSLRDVAHVLWPGEPASLAKLAERFNIVNEEAHRALCDVAATCKILEKADECLATKERESGTLGPMRAAGERIREMIEAAAAKRRAAIHGEEAADEAGDGERTGETTVQMQTLVAEAEDEDAVMEETSESEEEPVRFHFIPTGNIFHNNRACVALELSPTIHSVEKQPADRRLCRYCAVNWHPSTAEQGSEDDAAMSVTSFFIAPTGRLYHTDRACGNLDLARTIHRIDCVPERRYACSMCVEKETRK